MYNHHIFQDTSHRKTKSVHPPGARYEWCAVTTWWLGIGSWGSADGPTNLQRESSVSGAIQRKVPILISGDTNRLVVVVL